jgi:REP element-mobilizing transposase RayT
MARAWRIEYAGALYHVLARGNEGRAIFVDDRDRARFLDLLAEATERFDIAVFAYVLMGNHYHLLLRTRLPNLSKAMQWLGVSYTSRFNRRHRRAGHLFQGRFRSILVQNEGYMLRLSCYIHRNPVRAGLVARLADYRWSSYRAYAYGKPPGPWLETGTILSQMAGAQDLHRAYRERSQAYASEERSLWEDLHHGFVLGSTGFLREVRARHLPPSVNAEMPQQRGAARRVFDEAALQRAAAFLELDPRVGRLYGRGGNEAVQARDLLIFLAWRAGGQTNREIGERFGLTYSAVSRRVGIVRNGLKHDAQLNDRLEQLERVIGPSERVEGA